MKDGYYWARDHLTTDSQWHIVKITDGHLYHTGITGASHVNNRGRVTTYSLGQDYNTYYEFVGPLNPPGTP
jgi:predicted cupin superfamily sugar epimerase